MSAGQSSPERTSRSGASAQADVLGPMLAPAHYEAIHAFLESRAGIRLGPGKEYLITSRLRRLMGAHGIDDFPALVRRLQSATEMGLQVAVVDAMTTNETFWFRDAAHYRLLTETIIPELRDRQLRIWSAACSTGQEPYTIAMALREVRTGLVGPFEIVGTDISATALAQAREARYCGLAAARGLSDEQRRRYFRYEGDCLEVLAPYRQGVRFLEFNLLRPFDSLGRFDVIFCRNVLIYFSAERKRDILERMARVLRPGGYLLLGSTESMNGHADLYEMSAGHGGLAYRRR